MNKIYIKKIKDVKTPDQGTSRSAGIDMYVPNDFKAVVVKPQEAIMIPSGIIAKIPSGDFV